MMLPIGSLSKPLAHRGFTLVELLLIMVILAVIAVMAVPNFASNFKGVHLRQTSDDIRAISRWAQAMAVAEHRTYGLLFSKDRRNYQVVRAPLDDDEGQDLVPLTTRLGRRHTIPEDVQLNVQVDLIQFHPDGTIDPATIELAVNNKRITLSTVLMRGVLTVTDDQ